MGARNSSEREEARTTWVLMRCVKTLSLEKRFGYDARVGRIIKRITLSFVLLLLVGILLFPKQILIKCIEWKLGRYCQEAFGAKLILQNVCFENGTIIFKKGELQNQEKLQVFFEEARLVPFLDLKQREFGGELTIDSLKIIHCKRGSQTLPSPPPPSFKFLTLKLETSIEEGELFLYDYVSDNRFFQHVRFDVSHHVLANEAYGSVSFDWDPSTPKFTTHFHRRDEDSLILSADFRSHAFPVLSHLTTYFFQDYLPEPLLHWDISKGKIDGNVAMTIVGGEPLKLQGNVSLTDVQAKNRPLELRGEIDHVGCDLDIDFSQVTAISGEFDLSGGRLSLQEPKEFWKGMWDLTNLHSNICVKEGKVESSTLKGSFMGMEGELFLDWQANGKLMEMGFRGSSKEMISLLPDSIQEGFGEAFPDDFFSLDASLVRSGNGLELEGTLSIFDDKTLPYQLSFGCLFGKGSDSKVDVVPENLRFSFSRSVDSFLDHLMDQFCLSQKRFGWFRADHFPAQKFVSPFLLRDVRMELSGFIDFEGTFDDRYLVIFYEGESLCLDSPHFCFEVDRVKEHLTSQVGAVHYIDLLTWDHVGFLPIKDARYHQKNFGFSLENADTTIHFENNVIHIQDIVTSSEEIDFQGDVKITIEALNDVDLQISANHIGGSALGARTFIAHFKESFFWNIPFEGDVLGGQDSLLFHYNFSPKATLVSGRVNGEVYLSNHNPLFNLENYHATIDYDCKESCVEVKEGSGVLTLKQHPNPLIVATPSIKLYEFPDFLFDFTCCMQDGEKEVLNLSGHSTRLEAVKELFLTGSSTSVYDSLSLRAIQDGKDINVTEFMCGAWKGSAHFACEQQALLIKQIYCGANPKAGFTFTGIYDFPTKSLDGEIQELKWDLTAPFEKNMSPWKPSGDVLGLGTLHWEIGKELEARVTASFNDLEFGGIYFGSGEDLHCFFSSNYGFSVEGLEVEIPTEGGAEKYKLGCFHYDIKKQKILFEGFDFSLPPEKLPWVAEVASSLFPGKVHPTVVDSVEALKQNEPLEGRISLEVYPDNMWIYLSLKDGIYHLSDKKLNLKNFRLVYDPLALNVWTQYLYRDHYYWLHVFTDSMSMSHGKLALSEHILSPENQEGYEAIVATWERQKDKGWCVRKVEGGFSGIDIQMHASKKMDFSSEMTLVGKIGFDPEKAAPLLHEGGQKIIEKFSLSGGYSLEGEMRVDKEDFSNISFLGRMSGRECEMAQVGIEAFSSEIEYGNDAIKLTNFAVKDWAGRLSINEAIFSREGDNQEESQWSVSVDRLNLSDMRLSRLKSPWTQWSARDKPFFRSLFIRSFDLHNFSGKLAETDTLLGSGKVEFTNLPKRTLFSNLLFIPTEITARIGLDLTTLIPVRGTIEYEMRDGKVFFNEFKEVYSDGKRSRFYLAEGMPAYIDFNGHLNMKVKMKQYNLLMKLAEFFTISVKGTVLNPSYTFSNHIDDET